MVFERLARRARTELFRFRPAHLGLAWRDLRGVDRSRRPDEEHLALAIEWLCRSQDQTGDGGSSGGYYLGHGWRPAYPETTGYIIPTLLRFATTSGNPDLTQRACRMGDWETRVQLPDGGIPGGHGETGIPIVFNTGQVILGWTSLFRETGNPVYRRAACRAADWLCSVQEDDGSWIRHTFKGTPHAYKTRVAWALCEVAEAAGVDRYREAAAKNVAWVLRQVESDGWIRHMAFCPGEPVYTHTIAYTLRGLVESAPYLQGDLGSEVLYVVARATDAIRRMHRLDESGGPDLLWLPGALGPDWRGTESYSCVTGNAQMALVLMRLDEVCGTPGARQPAADRLIESAKAAQVVRTFSDDLRGGVAGSYPLWGGYKPWALLNWATKFLADALMLRIRQRERATGAGDARVNPTARLSTVESVR